MQFTSTARHRRRSGCPHITLGVPGVGRAGSASLGSEIKPEVLFWDQIQERRGGATGRAGDTGAASAVRGPKRRSGADSVGDKMNILGVKSELMCGGESECSEVKVR